MRGVIHSMWIGEKGLDELIVEDGVDLTERKRKLLDDADVIVALPGGVGTLDERMPGPGSQGGARGAARGQAASRRVDARRVRHDAGHRQRRARRRDRGRRVESPGLSSRRVTSSTALTWSRSSSE